MVMHTSPIGVDGYKDKFVVIDLLPPNMFPCHAVHPDALNMNPLCACRGESCPPFVRLCR